MCLEEHTELKLLPRVYTSGVVARDARLHSLSLELLSLSESDSELLSDSLELPEAPLEWPPGSLFRGVGPGRLQRHMQISRTLFICCTIKYKSLKMGVTNK